MCANTYVDKLFKYEPLYHLGYYVRNPLTVAELTRLPTVAELTRVPIVKIKQHLLSSLR